MEMAQLAEYLAEETEVLGDNLQACYLVTTNSALPNQVSRPPLREAGDERPELWHGRCISYI
jgi:hypothetical protein